MADGTRVAELPALHWPDRAAWQQPLAALLLCALWVLFWYRETALAMVGIWYRSDTFNHGFVVLPITLWLVWRSRKTLSLHRPKPFPWALLALALVGFGWLLGELASVNAVTQLALVTLLVLTVPAILGTTLSLAIAFPLMFMYFAVPIGEFAMPALMDWTAKFTVFALRATGIPVFNEGLQFVIPSGRWSVVEACSGVRYLIASVCVGTLYAYLNYVSLKRRLVFIGVSIAVPVVANWLRAYMIVMIGHLSDGRLAAGVDHLIYGWLFFGLVVILMFIAGSRWAEYPDARVADPGSTIPAPPLVSPLVPKHLLATTALVLLVTALPHAAKAWIAAREAVSQPIAIAEPVMQSWSRAESFSDWRPAYEDPSAEFRRTYAGPAGQVGVFIAYYRNQNHGRKLVSSTNVLVTSKDRDWAAVGFGKRSETIGGREVELRTAELRGHDQRLVAWQVYWVDGELTASQPMAKLLTALARLKGRGDDSAVIVTYAAANDGKGGVVLHDFAEREGAAILDALVRTREGRR